MRQQNLIVTAFFNKICQQNLSTKFVQQNFVNKICQQNLIVTAFFNKICQQNLSTKFVNKICSTKICQQNLSTKFDRYSTFPKIHFNSTF